jgi:hypothetical protein
MKYVIDDAVAEKMGLTLPQVLALMLIKTGENVEEVLEELANKEAIVAIDASKIKYKVTQRWNDLCDNVLLTSDKYVPKEDIIVPIAEKLMQIFPKGKKPGTPYYWKCNKREVSLKLKSFFKLYGNTYTEEQILNAARDYVDSFNGDYRFMRLLKYFIWKKDDEQGEISELATFIDNAGQENVNDDSNWVNTLV